MVQVPRPFQEVDVLRAADFFETVHAFVGYSGRLHITRDVFVCPGTYALRAPPVSPRGAPVCTSTKSATLWPWSNMLRIKLSGACMCTCRYPHLAMARDNFLLCRVASPQQPRGTVNRHTNPSNIAAGSFTLGSVILWAKGLATMSWAKRWAKASLARSCSASTSTPGANAR